MYEIPTSITVDGSKFHIRNDGDYRVVLDCFSALQDAELDTKERVLVCLLIFYDTFTAVSDLYQCTQLNELVEEMYKFFNCGAEQTQGTHSNYKLIDWEQDAQLISSAVNAVAHTEIRSEPYIHWWTFMGYYTAIGECPLSTIITIRHKLVTQQKLEKYERKFKADNPQYFVWRSVSVEKSDADQLLKEIWNSEG